MRANDWYNEHILNQNSYLDLISKNLCKQVEFYSAVECYTSFHF